MKNIFLILSIILCLPDIAFSQGIHEVDELNDQVEELVNSNTDSAIIIANKAIEYSEALNYPLGKAEALSFIGFSYYIKGDYENAKRYCLEAIRISEELYAESSLSRAYHALGLIYINQGKNDDAINIYTKLVDLASDGNNDYLLSDALSNLGLAYLNKKYYKRASEYIFAAIQVYKSIEHPYGQAFSNLNYGRLFFEQNDYDSAMHYLNIASDIAIAIDGERALLHIHSILGQIHLSNNKLNMAEQSFNKAYRIANDLDLKWETANLSSWLCETNYDKKNYKEALRYGEIAIKLARDGNIIYILQKINNIMAKSYLESGNVPDAEAHIKYMEFLIDSLALMDSTDLVNSIIDSKISKEEEQNLLFVSNQLAAAKAEISRRNTTLIGALISFALLTAILALIIRSNRNKTRTNNELLALNEKINAQKGRLEETIAKLDNTNKEKDLLVGMVAHDIRSPLNKISGLVNILKLQNGVDQGQHEVYDMVNRTITDANKLADELLEINKIESGAIDKTNESHSLMEFVNQVVTQYQPLANEKGIKLILKQECSETDITTDRKLLQRIFENLISNAIKFSPENSEVLIQITCPDDMIKFSVIDQGIGIPEEEHKFLFTKFGKTSARPTGGESSNGLGLYIVNQLTKTIGGTLTFRSKVGEGSQFSIGIPV